MAVLLQERKDEFASQTRVIYDRLIENSYDRLIENSYDRLIENSYDRLIENSYDRLIENSYDRLIENSFGHDLNYSKIRSYWEFAIFQTVLSQFENVINLSCPVSINNDESRLTTWNALYGNHLLPDVEENAVEKYAGSLDQYLPDNVPVDSVIKHAKG